MAKAKPKTKTKTKTKRLRSKVPAARDPVSPVLNELWPQERDLMLRPERLRYLRRAVVANEECVFCAVAATGPSAESLCLYKDRWGMVVLNKFPYNSGHVMVLPIRHCGDVTQLSEEEYSSIMRLLREAMKRIMSEYRCGGMNVGLNHGAVAGAGIPAHLHWHIVPRWAGDTNFFPLIAETKVVPETLEQTYARLLPHFKDLKP